MSWFKNLLKDKRTDKQKIGDQGEKVACKFLMKHGFRILGRNYWKKYGEIDIISEKNRELHFVEVKSVLRETQGEEVPRRTLDHQPEENVHFRKIQRLNRAIQCYLEEKNVSRETEWQIDVITVEFYRDVKKPKINFIENIILG